MQSRTVEDLAGRLRQAERLVEDLRQAERTPTVRYRFLRDPALLEKISRLGRVRGRVTLIVGAGASMEAGLPSWYGLVRRVLAATRPSLADNLREKWVDAVLAESVVVGAATAQAHAAAQADFRDLVRRQLYDGRTSASFAPGAISRQVAWWKAQFPDDVTVATFNYDDLLERALAARMPVASAVDADAEPAGQARVYHLHGRLNDADVDLDFVLTDDDYARFALTPRWQDDVMRRALTDSLCVFVGLSFSDPNLTRWIHRSNVQASVRHLALFSRQSSPQLAPDVRRELELSTAKRWANVGVDVLFTDFFSEIAQFLHEAALIRCASGVGDFPSRAKAARTRAEQLLAPRGSVRFPRAQQRASEWMRDLVDGVVAIARASNIRFRNEQIGAGLWLVDHAEGEIVLAASSDRAITERGAMRPIRLDLASAWTAVEAVTRGAVQNDADVYASRWRHVRGLPLEINADGEGRLVAGVLTLTSTKPWAESALSRLRPDVLDAAEQFAAAHALGAFA